MRETVSRFIRAHLYGAMVIGTFVVLFPILLKPLDAYLPVALPGFLRYGGMLVFPLGAALSYTSFWLFITRGRGTAFPTDPPRELVILGPYRYVRNPMYIGNLTMILGVALFLTSLVLLLYTIAMSFLTHLYVTASEEPGLKRRYGEPYRAYMKTTPRWLPKFQREVGRC